MVQHSKYIQLVCQKPKTDSTVNTGQQQYFYYQDSRIKTTKDVNYNFLLSQKVKQTYSDNVKWIDGNLYR